MMPKGGGSKTPQLDHFPLNTDMVEKQGGKKVILYTHTQKKNICIQHIIPVFFLICPWNLALQSTASDQQLHNLVKPK